ncbi:MAG: hypothetical protein JJT78_09140 [Leptospira sp.]|nr:hypothetical protein [Leptospira sp.]
MKKNIMTLLMIISLFSCVGNFFPNDEETGEAAEQRCLLGFIALFESNSRGEECGELCNYFILKNCNKKESKQLIQLK